MDGSIVVAQNEVLSVEDGIALLSQKEEIAACNLHTSERAFSEAIVALAEIESRALWHYAVDADGIMLRDYQKPRFKEDYLNGIFCARNGISISSVYDHLATMRSWRALNRPMDQLVEVGVRRAKPVQDLLPVDGRSGEIKMPTQAVIESLPGEPEDDPIDRINMKIDEVLVQPAEPLRPADTRKAMLNDTGHETNIEVFEAKAGDIWAVCDDWDGVVIVAEKWQAMPEELKEFFTKKLKIRRVQ